VEPPSLLLRTESTGLSLRPIDARRFSSNPHQGLECTRSGLDPEGPITPFGTTLPFPSSSPPPVGFFFSETSFSFLSSAVGFPPPQDKVHPVPSTRGVVEVFFRTFPFFFFISFLLVDERSYLFSPGRYLPYLPPILVFYIHLPSASGRSFGGRVPQGLRAFFFETPLQMQFLPRGPWGQDALRTSGFVA